MVRTGRLFTPMSTTAVSMNQGATSQQTNRLTGCGYYVMEGPEFLFVWLRSTATWPLDPSKEEKQGWRHVRIKQMGKNASGQTHYLSLSGLELYGTVTAVCEDQLGKQPFCPSACPPAGFK